MATKLNPKSKALLQQMLMQDCDIYPSVFEARKHLLEVEVIISKITQEEFDLAQGINGN